jgi:hypothetical protein
MAIELTLFSSVYGAAQWQLMVLKKTLFIKALLISKHSAIPQSCVENMAVMDACAG